MKTKFFFTDIDGVWTDGSMYYADDGAELKRFSTYDSAGVLFLKSIGIETVIVTGESNPVVTRRAEKLGIDHVFLGIKNKKELLTDFCSNHQVLLENQPYIGDDINDIEMLQISRYSYCPTSAPEYTKSFVVHVVNTKGGEGAFRDAVIHYINLHHDFEQILNKIVKNDYRQ